MSLQLFSETVGHAFNPAMMLSNHSLESRVHTLSTVVKKTADLDSVCDLAEKAVKGQSYE